MSCLSILSSFLPSLSWMHTHTCLYPILSRKQNPPMVINKSVINVVLWSQIWNPVGSTQQCLLPLMKCWFYIFVIGRILLQTKIWFCTSVMAPCFEGHCNMRAESGFQYPMHKSDMSMRMSAIRISHSLPQRPLCLWDYSLILVVIK